MVELSCAYSTFTRRMRWAVHYLLLLLPTALSYVDSGRILPPVFWNSSNTMFQSSNNDHMIDVNLGDSLNILCPHYTDTTVSSNQWEYYLIYMVDKYNYEVCVINDTSNKIPILNCSNPEYPKFFTLLIFEFQPIPGIPDFELGKDYYFISTSGGRKFNMDNQYEGACKEHQMKMVLRVRPKSTDTSDGGSNSNSGSGGSKPDTPRPTPSPTNPSTSSTTTTTTTTTTTIRRTTPRPSHSSHPTEKPKDGDEVPGSDGFPDDDKVIHAGEGSNINSGIIGDDNGMGNSGFSLHYNQERHRHCFQCISVIFVSLLISMALLVR